MWLKKRVVSERERPLSNDIQFIATTSFDPGHPGNQAAHAL
jgi:hypothetical protein